MDIAKLSDAELREALIANGTNVGPIMASTRSVYEKKLERLVKESGDGGTNISTTQNGTPMNKRVSVSPAKSRKTSASPARKTPTPVQSNESDEHFSDDEDAYEGEESMRYLSDEELKLDRTLRNGNNKSKSSGNWVIIAFAALLLAIFTYFLIENQNLSPIPIGISDEIN